MAIFEHLRLVPVQDPVGVQILECECDLDKEAHDLWLTDRLSSERYSSGAWVSGHAH